VHLIDKICDRFIKLEQANKGPDGHDLASGDHSSRSKQDEYAQLLSPQGTRGRKKQPKQSKSHSKNSFRVTFRECHRSLAKAIALGSSLTTREHGREVEHYSKEDNGSPREKGS